MYEEISIEQHILVGKKIFNPEYREQEVDEYKDNPCIEALPLIFDDDDITDRLLVEVKVNELEINNRANVRYHYINRVKDFFLPLDCHYKLEHTLSSMVRRVYEARNPISQGYLLRIRLLNTVKSSIKENNISDPIEICRILANQFDEIPEAQRSTAESASVIGVSGEGKSVSIEKLLLMYPQVIYHHQYKGNLLIRTQIVWLKIDCPFDGSLKTLCKMFFKAIDTVLGNTNYFRKFGDNRNSTATMMILMSHLTSLYSIGVLVVDEIQHIIHPNSKPDEILNFFVTLVNTIGVSVLFIGTPKVWDVLGKGLRNIRRFTESGCSCWLRKAKDDPEWNYLIEVMWEYQWLRNYTKLTDKLKECLYYHSQGIIAVAKALFILAQKQAIFDSSEKITVELLNETAKNDLGPLQKLIGAIRNKKTENIEDYEDIEININTLLQNQQAKVDLHKRMQDSAQRKIQSKKENVSTIIGLIAAEFEAIQIFKNLKTEQMEAIINNAIKQIGLNGDISEIKRIALFDGLEEERKLNSNKRKGRNDKGDSGVSFTQGDLRKLYFQSKEDHRHIFDILNESGYIKDLFNDFTINGINLNAINII